MFDDYIRCIYLEETRISFSFYSFCSDIIAKGKKEERKREIERDDKLFNKVSLELELDLI